MNFFGLLIPEESEGADGCDICKLVALRSVLAEIDLDGVPYWAHESCIVKLPGKTVSVLSWARQPEPYNVEITPAAATRRIQITKEQLACPVTT